MTRSSLALLVAWLALVLAACCSFLATDFVGSKDAAVGVTMTIAVAKSVTVLRSFMGAEELPRPIAWSAYAWIGACGIMITALAAAGR